MMAASMYAAQEGTLFVLRQERYRVQLAAGREHPHDVCVVATSAQQLKEMSIPHWPDADFSAVLPPEAKP